MPIEYPESGVLYEESAPARPQPPRQLSRDGPLASGEIIALFVMAEAFEAADGTTWAARSRDLGRTWTIEDGQGKIRTHRLRVRQGGS